MASRTIPNVPRIAQFIGKDSYLTPYIGSLYTALHGMGIPKPYSDLLAMSGAGNRLAWKPGIWNPGNIDVLMCEDPPFAPHQRVLRALGLKADVHMCRELAGLGFVGPYISEDVARRDIVASIDKGLPVIAMGILGPPECCVVFGYEDDGARLTGWNFYQGDEGYDPDQPFTKENWFPGLFGYQILSPGEPTPTENESALAAFRAITTHARQGEVRGAKVGFAAWESMLDHLEHDDFAGLPLLLPPPGDPSWETAWQGTVQGRFFVYCDALSQIWERSVALPYYLRLSETNPEWKPELDGAISAWKECAAYGEFLWKHVSMKPEGFEKFRTPEIRKILADEGKRSYAKDVEAIESVERLLRRL